MIKINGKRIIALLLCLVLTGVTLNLCACKRTEPVVDPIDDNYRVFYEIFVGSFSDSDGDGIGDIRGIINRMDYLNDGDINSGESLGVQGLWLSPIFSSPSYHKYDAADYYAIDEDFGTEDDLKELLELCHERNVKVIIDLPINHTSSANALFQRFTNAHKSGDTANEYYNFYVHCTSSTKVNGRTYAPIPNCSDDYYECNFSTDMPELNFDNDAVRQYVLTLAKYYLDLGIDGFRFDAIKYVYYSNTVKSVDFWDWYMAQLKAYKSDIYCVGECWSADAEIYKYTSSLNCFMFSAAQGEGYIASAVKGNNMSVYTNYVAKTAQTLGKDGAMFIPFIANHDMDRSAGYLTLATKRAYMAANLYILCSGSPFIYYGEEIGLKGSRGGSTTDANRRLAMLWGDGDKVKDPIGTTYKSSNQTNGTVKQQVQDEASLYNHYRRLIALRNKYPAIARGEYKPVAYNLSCFGGWKITYNDEVIGLFHNTSDNEITIDLLDSLPVNTVNFTQLADFIGQGSATLNGTLLTIGAKTSVILK